MRLASIVSICLIASTPALANEKPAFGPVPSWVKRQTLPALPAPDQAAARLIMMDNQTRFERDGSVIRYRELAVQVQTSDGLAAGNVAVAWRPDMDDITIHQLQLVRGGKVIDVLAAGKNFTVIRRETDLEAAKLDGILTATLQIDGVEVGDIVLMSTSVVTRDPVMGSHAEDVGAVWNGIPIELGHLRMEWPADRRLQYRSEGDLAPIKTSKSGGYQALDLTMTKVQPQLAPSGAPERFRRGRFLEATDFSSWNDIAALLGPLYIKASTIPPAGPLRAELDAIKASSSDPMKRVEAALQLVQGKVRYVAIQMGASGLVPADAAATWESRYGDCKAKTVLLLALLREMGIDAEAVAVSATAGDGMDNRLPRIGQFDHVLVRAKVDGKTYWLDGTRTGDVNLAYLETPAFGWGLPLVSGNAQLVRMEPAAPTRPTEDRVLEIDARQGVYSPARVRAQVIYQGDGARQFNMLLSNVTADVRNEALKRFWKERLNDVEPEKVTATYDESTASELLTIEGSVKLDWDDGYWFVPWSGSGFNADFSRTEGPNRDAPFSVDHPSYVTVKTTIQLPPGIEVWKGKGSLDVSKTLAGVDYRRRVTMEKGTFKLERSERSVQPEVSFAQAQAAQSELRRMDDTDAYLELANYAPTDADVKARLATAPGNYEEYLDRGLTLMRGEKYDEAIADFTRAHELEPKRAWPLANRGLAHAWKNEVEAARTDFAAARALDPTNPVILRGEGLLNVRAGDTAGAIKSFTSSLDREPGNSFALNQRARLYRSNKQFAEALADTDALLKAGRDIANIRLLRANIHRAQDNKVLVAREAEMLMQEMPGDSYAQVVSARIFDELGRREDALTAINRALAIKPESYIYINRAEIRPKADIAGRRADVDEALKLEPKSTAALMTRADIELRERQYADAISYLSQALEDEPDSIHVRVQRGIALSLAGKSELATKDFSEARRLAKTPRDFNELCWAKATWGVDLKGALDDCSTALAKAPDTPAYLDSRGLVHLRLGRLDDAIADYSRALAKVPELAPSLFGRGLAYSKKGETKKAELDRANAIKSEPGIIEEFEEYGMGSL